MSNIYLNEPPTCGKVLLHTSLGDIDIELWSKEAPLACRNFIQLSLEGYYDGTLFHRIIKDFMAQGGDPSNTGKGGASIWGRPFKDEIHGRIKFNHRGQLAMANENKPNTNQSQFFITLGDCEWLNRKHTIFGKVTGNTIFNLLRMSDTECGEDDRPLEDIVVKSIEVLWNPFDDIIPRHVKTTPAVTDGGQSLQTKNKQHRKGKKDLKLLSFGEEALELECEEKNEAPKKMISAHDVEKSGGSSQVFLSAKVDPNLKSSTDSSSAHILPSSKPIKEVQKDEIILAGGSGRVDAVFGVDAVSDDRRKFSEHAEVKADNDDSDREGESTMSGNLSYNDKSKEVDRIKKDILRSRRAVKVMTGEEAAKHRDDAALKDFITPLERQRQRFIKRKREHGDREKETLSKLQQFSRNLKTQKNNVHSVGEAMHSAETYRGQVLENDDVDDGDDEEWHIGKLKFRKHIDDAYRVGQNLKDYTVIDPKRPQSSSSTSVTKH